MKPFKRDAEIWRKAWRTRNANLARIIREVPQTLTADLLTLTVCCRYAESLLKNPRIRKYVTQHYPKEVRGLEMLLAEFERG